MAQTRRFRVACLLSVASRQARVLPARTVRCRAGVGGSVLPAWRLRRAVRGRYRRSRRDRASRRRRGDGPGRSHSTGVFPSEWRVARDYARFETVFLQYAEAGDVRASALDLCIWAQALQVGARFFPND